ncbi:hypothetical protein [Candidatus Hartigia pinicola]
MKWLKWVCLPILCFIILVLSLLSWLVFTQSGLKFVLNSTTRFVPGLEIRNIKGNINNLTLVGVQYQRSGINVNMQKVHFSLRLKCLISQELCIDDLSTHGVVVNINTNKIYSSEKSLSSERLTELKSPLPIKLNQLLLTATQVTIDGIKFNLAKFKTGMYWKKKT